MFGFAATKLMLFVSKTTISFRYGSAVKKISYDTGNPKVGLWFNSFTFFRGWGLKFYFENKNEPIARYDRKLTVEFRRKLYTKSGRKIRLAGIGSLSYSNYYNQSQSQKAFTSSKPQGSL